MGATPDFNRPAWANPIDEDLDWIRDNFNFLLCMCANGSPVIPGWTTTVDVDSNNNYARPDGYVLTKGTRAIYLNMEWTQKTYTDVSPNTTQWVISQLTVGYDDGVSSPGLTWFDPVTLTIQSGADPNILWDDTPITAYRYDPDASANVWANLEFLNNEADYGYSSLPSLPWIVYAACFTTFPTGAGEYIFKADIVSTVSGTGNLEVGFLTSNDGVWMDVYTDGSIDLGDTTANSVAEHMILDVSIAADDGTGNPVSGSVKTKRVTMLAYKGSNEFYVEDEFTDTNGTNLTAHTPNKDAVGGGWSALAGTFEIQSNEAESISGAAAYSIDTGQTDHEAAIQLQFNGVEAGIIGRIQDSSNYWELIITDRTTSNPILKLNKVVSGTPTTVASKTLTGVGPITSAANVKMRLKFEGNDITGATNYSYPLLEPSEVTYTDSTYNTETACGMIADGAGVEITTFTASVPAP